jgi:SNF2 family DNA or RNA helicase
MQFLPHPYQAYCIEQLIERPRLGLFLEMGLGKTVITLTAIHDLKFDRFAIHRALVIAPRKVAEGTWSREAEKWDHLKGLRVSVALGSEKQRIRALTKDADVYVINRENTVWLCEKFGNEWPFDMVVCDEFSSFKSHSAERFKALKRILPKISRLVGLTGTPAPNGLQDLWAQVYLLDEGQRLGKTWSGFQDRYFHYNPYNHELKEKNDAEETVKSLIGDICISMRSEDYLTLPPLIVDDIPVFLSAAARSAYDKMERDCLLELQDTTIEAGSAVALTGKLLQLCGGSVYDTETGTPYTVHGDKLAALAELLEGLHGQHALLFYGFRHEVDKLLSTCGKLGLRARQLATQADADAWNRGEIDVLLAHPASCAYGLNLQQGGRHVIWYTLTWSLELYQQANARLHRQGQTAGPVIVHRLLVDGGMDCDVAAALEGKRDVQDALMDALRARIEKVRESV